jgi:hypothetical protein
MLDTTFLSERIHIHPLLSKDFIPCFNEACNFDIHMLVKVNDVRIDVPVDESIIMHGLDCKEQLSHDALDDFCGQWMDFCPLNLLMKPLK